MEEHIAYYRGMIEVDPRNIDAHLRLAGLWRARGELDRAVGCYHAAAALLAEEGLTLEAVTACRAIFELDPHHQGAQQLLARLYARRTPEPGRVVHVISEVTGPVPEEELIILSAQDAVQELDDAEVELLGSLGFGASGAESADEAWEAALELTDADLLELVEGPPGGLGGAEPVGALHELEEFPEPPTEPLLLSAPSGQGERRGEEGALPATPLFERLDPQSLAALLRQTPLREVPPGACVIQAGVPHRRLFVILQGRVRVEWQGEVLLCLARLGRGAFIGEFELLTGQTPRVSVRAETPVAMLELSRDVIDAIAQRDPGIWEVLWSFYHDRLLNNLLATSALFMDLEPEVRAQLAREFSRARVEAGEVIIRQGQPGPGLFLIAQGSVVVQHDGQEQPQEVARLRSGDFFGTVSSVTRSPAMATLVACEQTELLFLHRAKIEALGRQHPAVWHALRRLAAYRQIVVGRTGYARPDR